MSIHNIEKFFDPRGIVVIGASLKENSVGYKVMRNITSSGYQGFILPFNPNYSELMGLKCYASFKDIRVPADLAVIATPIGAVPKMIRECIEAGIGGAVILSVEVRRQERKVERLKRR